jgi:tetratricopeptide (TPR) repeat protein
MFWRRSEKKDNAVVIRYLQRRLLELVEEFKRENRPDTPLAGLQPKLDRIISLFLELGHLFHLNAQFKEEAQIKAQAAKFLLALPPQREVNRLEMARQSLQEAIKALEHAAPSLTLADAHITLAEILSRGAAAEQDGTRRRAVHDAAEAHLRAGLDIVTATAAQEKPGAANEAIRVLRELATADLYNKLGNLEKDRAVNEPGDRTRRLHKAREYYEVGLTHCRRELSPDIFAMTQNNLGSVEVLLSRLGDDDALLKQAEGRFEAALTALSKDKQPQLHALVHGNLAELLLLMVDTKLRSKYESLQHAIMHFGEALPAFPADRFPQQRAKILYGQGRALALMGQREEAKKLLEDALALKEHLPDNGQQIAETLEDLQQ